MHTLLPYLSLYKHHKWMLISGIILMIITLLSSFGLLSLSGWFLSASYIAGGGEGLYSFNYILPAVGVRFAAILRTTGKYFERLVSHDLTFLVLQHLRVRTFTKLFSLSPSRLFHFRQGELLNHVISDINTLDHLYLRFLSPLIGTFVVIITIMLGLSILDIRSSLTLGFIMLFAFLFFSMLFFYAGKSVGENLSRLRGEYRKKLTSWIQGQAELSMFGASKRYREQMEIIEFTWNKEQRYQSRLTAFSLALMILFSGTCILIMLWITGEKVKIDQYFDELVPLFVFCSFSVFEVMLPIANAFQYLGQVITSASLLSNILKQKTEVHFPNKYSEIPLQVSLHLNNVTFTYEGRTQNVLENITFSVKRGMHVAILGHTGCGKSTLFHLLARTWDPKQGSITLNDTPIHQFSKKALRSIIGIVPQRVYLFSASLRDNLLLSPSKTERDEVLYAVLEEVGLKYLADENTLNGWFGEGGRQLSGGELRRLAIARMILHNAPLILLDEPTEGLDSVTETKIMELIRKVLYNKTLLMVTHRVYGLSRFDKILVMDNGRIIEEGHHNALLLRKGLYSKLKQYS